VIGCRNEHRRAGIEQDEDRKFLLFLESLYVETVASSINTPVDMPRIISKFVASII
jgi:hypothetical protein